MAKNKLLATEPAGDAALLNGQPVKEKHESIWKDVFAGIVSNKASLVSGIFILILAAIAIVTKLAPGILPYDPYAQNLGESLLGPSAQHWFGTDIQGRDIFCRVLVGTQITLTVGLAAVAISLTVGVILGSIAGYKGGKWDTVIMRIMDMMLGPTTRTRRTSANRCWGPRRSTGSAPTSKAATSSAACSWARRSR